MMNIGYIGVVETENSSMTTSKTTNNGRSNYDMITKVNHYDKPSGSYMRSTAKESSSSGNYSYRGRDGYKDEYKTSSTVKVGDKGGYTEYFKQERVTRVNYDSGYNNYSGGSKGYNTNNSSGGSKGYNNYATGGKKYIN